MGIRAELLICLATMLLELETLNDKPYYNCWILEELFLKI